MAEGGANVEIHDSIFLTNSVSGYVSLSTHREISQIFALIPGAGHATSRVELFLLSNQMSRSTPAFSRATVLAM